MDRCTSKEVTHGEQRPSDGGRQRVDGEESDEKRVNDLCELWARGGDSVFRCSWLSARSLAGQQPMAAAWWIADRHGRRLYRIGESSKTAVALAAVQRLT